MAAEILYIGTYLGKNGSEGIYTVCFDSAEQAARVQSVLPTRGSPSHLALRGERLYAVNEMDHGGGITACCCDRRSGTLAELNHAATPGAGMCYLALDRAGRYLYAANYIAGSLVICPVLEDGRVGEMCGSVQHQGHSVDPRRQDRQHAHSVNPDPAGRYLIAADLGMDKLMIYAVDAATGMLSPNRAQSAADTPAGAGPRHLVFHPNGKTVYVTTEMGNQLIVYDYDGVAGTLREKQIAPLLPPAYAGESFAAHLQLTPDAGTLFVSNRGWDQLSVFRLDDGGGLRALPPVPAFGRWPRHFCISPGGDFLAVAYQNSGNLVFLSLKNGSVAQKICEVAIPSPVCVIWQ